MATVDFEDFPGYKAGSMERVVGDRPWTRTPDTGDVLLTIEVMEDERTRVAVRIKEAWAPFTPSWELLPDWLREKYLTAADVAIEAIRSAHPS